MPDGATPASITHAIDVRVLRQPPQEATIEGGVAAVSAQAAVTLGPPLEGGPWAALYDPLLKGGHRTAIYAVDGRARIPGRFAIDWVRLPRGRRGAARAQGTTGRSQRLWCQRSGRRRCHGRGRRGRHRGPDPAADSPREGQRQLRVPGSRCRTLCLLRAPEAGQRRRTSRRSGEARPGHRAARLVGQHLHRTASALPRRRRQLAARRRGRALRLRALRTSRRLHVDRGGASGTALRRRSPLHSSRTLARHRTPSSAFRRVPAPGLRPAIPTSSPPRLPRRRRWPVWSATRPRDRCVAPRPTAAAARRAGRER